MVLRRDEIPSFDSYPFSIPVVRNLKRLDFHPAITYIVGENGTGKSTLLEAIAVAAGFNAEGGSKNFRFATRETHSALHEYVKVARGSRRERDGFFLRAESFYNVATELDYIDGDGVPKPTLRETNLREALQEAKKNLEHHLGDHRIGSEEFLARLESVINPPDLRAGGGCIRASYGGPPHEKSHGEAFLALLKHRFGKESLLILDEPESALSPARQLSVLLRIHELVKEGRCQFIIATHSPLLMAYPDSKMFSLGQDKISEISWTETEHYELTKSFLNRPDHFLHHLLGG